MYVVPQHLIRCVLGSQYLVNLAYGMRIITSDGVLHTAPILRIALPVVSMQSMVRCHYSHSVTKPIGTKEIALSFLPQAGMRVILK